MPSKKKPATPAKARSNAQRLMIRLPDELRAAWQADADEAAGVENAMLGPWVRDMVQRARRAAVRAVRG